VRCSSEYLPTVSNRPLGVACGVGEPSIELLVLRAAPALTGVSVAVLEDDNDDR
jgi:hypothetical protein